MSKKNRFNKFRKNKSVVSENVVNQEKSEEQMEKSHSLEKGYNMKLDFLILGIIFIVFIGFLVWLYYYDQQNNILAKLAKQLVSLF